MEHLSAHSVDDNRRLQWFDNYLQREGLRGQQSYQAEHSCPCCHYPTLEIRNQSEICFLCGWEDDGQDDPRADEIWGDPNKDYSLTEARENFRRYRTMYRPDDGEMFRRTRYRVLPSGQKLDLIQVKEHIMQVFDALTGASSQQPALLQQLNQLIQKLH